jgi:hypothetical protein
MHVLLFAYWVNILILTPIAIPTVFKLYATDQARFPESAGWRILVGALWTAILALSALGLSQPLRYSPVLLLQLVYKSVWLAVYVIPRLPRGNLRAIPWGIAVSFAAIVIVWPFIIPWKYLLGDV